MRRSLALAALIFTIAAPSFAAEVSLGRAMCMLTGHESIYNRVRVSVAVDSGKVTLKLTGDAITNGRYHFEDKAYPLRPGQLVTMAYDELSSTLPDNNITITRRRVTRMGSNSTICELENPINLLTIVDFVKRGQE